MGYRINTRNFENGQNDSECLTVLQWKKHITRHCDDWTKDELLEQFGKYQNAVKAIDKLEASGWFVVPINPTE